MTTRPKKRTITQINADIDRARRLRDRHDDAIVSLEEELLEQIRPIEPDTSTEICPVVRFVKFHGGYAQTTVGPKVYTYAALGWKGLWYITQSTENLKAMTWEELLRWSGRSQWHTFEFLD